MKNICVVGHANNISINEKNTKWAKAVADFVLENNYQLTTGGCIGIPELVANDVAARGGNVLAYSPGFNASEHVTDFGFAENKNIKMRYLKPSKASKNAKFLYRSVDLVDEADLVICFKGTWGTLSELVFAVMCSKKILFLNIDGDNETLKEIYSLMQKINLYNWHESFIEINSISKLKEELEKFKSENK